MVVDNERKVKLANRSGFPYVSFGPGCRWKRWVGRGVEASVGGFEGVVEAQRPAKESLIVRRLVVVGVLESRQYSYAILALRRGR